MIRVIGNFQFRSPKNNRVKAFMDWLSQFEGCQFILEDWKNFKAKVNERVDYYNREAKHGGYRIEVSFTKGQISVTCGNGRTGEWFSQLFITVIPVKSVYNGQLGEAVGMYYDKDEEGGEV